MSDDTIAVRLREHYNTFSPTERKVAGVVKPIPHCGFGNHCPMGTKSRRQRAIGVAFGQQTRF